MNEFGNWSISQILSYGIAMTST